jgi:L-threonylcarbamoyladenylate synthase
MSEQESLLSRLRMGAVVAYPTEGVWGLGCDPHNEHAVHRILTIKQRSVESGLILLASSVDQLSPYLQGLSAELVAQVGKEESGPVTFLIPDNGYCPSWIRGQHESVAVRVTNHPTVAAITAALGGPIVSTSANRHGEPTLSSAEAIRESLGDEIDGIVAGELGAAAGASEIRDLKTGQIIREGGK